VAGFAAVLTDALSGFPRFRCGPLRLIDLRVVLAVVEAGAARDTFRFRAEITERHFSADEDADGLDALNDYDVGLLLVVDDEALSFGVLEVLDHFADLGEARNAPPRDCG